MKKLWLALAGMVLAFSASAAQFQDGKQYYNVLDFINLKDMQESKRIFYQTMEQAVPDTAIYIKE